MDRIICELCQRQHETQDMDEAIAQGWYPGLDGWECLKCNTDGPQEASDA
ncbi:hypothetical protein [Stenotrophomonas terrae]|nr:hypothetical protein [Stenotrophomonas terrae]